MTQISKYMMLAYLLICPIMYPLTDVTIKQFQEVTFQNLGMLLVVTATRNIWMMLFMFLNIALCAINGMEVGQSQVLNIFFGICIFMTARRFFKVFKFEREMSILFWVGGLSLLWAGLQIMAIDPIYMGANGAGERLFDHIFNDPIGLFGLKAHHAIFFAILVPLVASRCLWASLLLFIPMWICRSSGAMLAGTVALMFYVFFANRKLFKYFAIGGVLASLCFIFLVDYKMDKEMFLSRFPQWHSAVRFTFIRPLGYGPDSWRNRTKHKDFLFLGDEDRNHWIQHKPDKETEVLRYYHPNLYKASHPDKELNPKSFSHWAECHNEYIQTFFEYGFLGLILLFGFIREMYFRFRYRIKDRELVLITSCLLVYAVSSITQFPLHVARLAFLFPVLLGAFYAKTDTNGGSL